MGRRAGILKAHRASRRAQPDAGLCAGSCGQSSASVYADVSYKLPDEDSATDQYVHAHVSIGFFTESQANFTINIEHEHHSPEHGTKAYRQEIKFSLDPNWIPAFLRALTEAVELSKRLRIDEPLNRPPSRIAPSLPTEVVRVPRIATERV